MNKFNLGRLSNLTPNGLMTDPEEAAHGPYPYYMGVELELENVNTQLAPAGWEAHQDQSLRNGIEFVTRGPIAGSRLARVLTAYFGSGITANNSPRTSTHIHVNASDLLIGQLRTMMTLSFIAETALFDIIGRSRKYCGYCMPLREMSPQRFRKFLTTTSINEFAGTLGGRNEDKYYGFNVNSVRKHGTVEFRYFAGGPTQEELVSWMDYCIGIKKTALNISFEELLSLQSAEDLAAVLQQHMGAWGNTLINFQGPQALFDALQEVVVMFPEPQDKVREDELVFVSPPLLKAVCVLNRVDTGGDAWKNFKEEAKRLSVTTVPVWRKMVNTMVLNSQRAAMEGSVAIADNGFPPRVNPPRYFQPDMPRVHPRVSGQAPTAQSILDLGARIRGSNMVAFPEDEQEQF